MQQDWYLHEQRTPAPVTTITPIGGSLGANFSLCPSGTYTLTINSNFPGIQAGDYLLVRMYIESGGSTTPAKWMSLAENLTWIDWKETIAPGGNNQGVGPPTVWAGGFVSSAGEKFIFANNGTNARDWCFSAWALRGVSKTQPVDYVYYGFHSGPTDRVFNSLSLTLNVGGAIWACPPPAGKENCLQIGEHVLIGTGTGSYSFYGSWHGPSSDYYLGTRVTQVNVFGAFAPYYVELFADYVAANKFEESTQTTLPVTASGGVRTWTRLGTATSATWISSPSYIRGFFGVTGTLTAIQQYQKRVVLTPGHEYAFWVHMGRRTSSGQGDLGMSVLDPLSNEFGASVRSFRTSLRFDWYKPFNGGFKKYGVHRNNCDGVPSDVAEVYLGIFDASLTGTYQFNVFTTTDGEETGKSNLGSLWALPAAGVNPTNKSIGLPYFNPVLGIPYGITRVALMENTATGFGSGWNTSYSSSYSRFFSLKPENVEVTPFYMIGHGSRFLSIAPELPIQGNTFRNRPYGQETQSFESNRAIWPRRYETSTTSTWTYGHYYAELAVSQISDTANFRYGLMFSTSRRDGFGIGGTGFLTLTGNGTLTNSTGGNITLSSGSIVTLNTGCIIGVEIDYAPSERSIVFSRDGSEFANFRMADTTIGFYSYNQPMKLFIQTGQINSRTTVQVNFAGSFSHKPAGAVAFDWQNEVP